MEVPATHGDLLDAARQAFRRNAWSSAYTALARAEQAVALTADDLERSAIAAHLIGQDSDRDERLSRAHHEYLGAGDVEGAARCAFWLGFLLSMSGERARGGGWLARAKRVLDDAAVDSVVRGYLMLPIAIGVATEGNGAAALAMFTEALDVGRRFRDEDLVTMARHGQGRVLIRSGSVAEGMSLIDEVMVAITLGELSPIAAGGVYCSVLQACHDVFDLRRAHEWTHAFAEWCSRQPDLVPFRGHCLIRRAEVLQLKGDWADAMDEARRACQRLDGTSDRSATGSAHYRRGELHRLRGELAAADAAYRQAAQCGRQPQPGVALLRFAQNQTQAATASIRNAIGGASMPESRAEILLAAIEILLAVDDVDGAKAACEDLAQMAAMLNAQYLRTTSAHARGAILVATGDALPALAELRIALAGWEGMQAPYEAARVRTTIAAAHRAIGDDGSASDELATARRTFEALGATTDVERVDRLLNARRTKNDDDVLTAREVDVIVLLATGKTNRAIATALGISEKTVARHTANIFSKLNITSRAAATAYAYEHALCGPGSADAST